MHNLSWSNKLSLITSNQLLLEACVFIRNVIIARLIGAETLGEFIFLVLGIRFFAMSTDLAVDRFILQIEEKSVNQALAGAHFIIRTRSGLLGIFLLIMGFFTLQGISPICYILLAVGSFVRGFTHQGYRLQQRQFDFRPAIYVESFSAVAATLAMYMTALYFPSLEAMCAILLVQSILHTAASHTVAKQPYYAPASSSMLKQQVVFGLPLLLAGVAMFWSMQGERVILATVLSATDFAHFSMLFQLALVPILIVGRIALTLGLPLMAQHKETPADFKESLSAFQKYCFGISVLFIPFFILGANPVLVLLFGADFEAEFALISLVAIAQSIRLIRTPHSVAAQALSHTDIPFKANIVRVLAVPIAGACIVVTGSLHTMLLVACIGEAAAWAVQRHLFNARDAKPKTSQPIIELLKTIKQKEVIQ